MMLQPRQFTLAASLVGVAFAHVARADVYTDNLSDPGPSTTQSVWRDPRLATGIGIGIDVGGGVFGFTDATMRSVASPVGGMWNFRASLGTHVPLGVEIGYVGSASTINSQLGRAQATLVGTTVEAALRWNVLPQFPWTPYAFAGVGWQRYSLDDRAFQLSDTGIANQDDLVVLPLGLGIAYRIGAFVTDVRGTFRVAEGSSLVLETPQSSLQNGFGGYAAMHQWDASVNVGYEF